MDCPYIPRTSYGDWSLRLHQAVADQRIPLSGSIDVTERCNLRCAHCYINRPAGDGEARARELSREEWCSLLDQMADEGCLWLLLTGGEPFLRPDFLEIYTHAKKRGMLVTVFTNGTTITRRIADALAEWRPFSIEITLYGRTPATYERVTGVPGSYARCVAGIGRLLERKLPLKLKSTLMTLNRHEVWDMKAYAEGLGLGYRFDSMLNLRVDGGQGPAQVRIPPQEVVALDLADGERVREWREFCEKFWGPPPQPEYLYQCSAGLTTFHVDPYGRLSACMMSRAQSYDLRAGTFGEGWRAFLPRVRTQPWTRETRCRRCELFMLCGQCPAWAQMESGDPEAPVDYLCQIAHLRAGVFGPNGAEEEESHDGKAGRKDHEAALPQATIGTGAVGGGGGGTAELQSRG
jgi:radical SAM protein with 4Fe4S-binding SPASM domain